MIPERLVIDTIFFWLLAATGSRNASATASAPYTFTSITRANSAWSSDPSACPLHVAEHARVVDQHVDRTVRVLRGERVDRRAFRDVESLHRDSEVARSERAELG